MRTQTIRRQDTRKSVSGIIHTLKTPPSTGTLSDRHISTVNLRGKYISASMEVQQTKWLQRLLQELSQKVAGLTLFCIDIQSAIKVATSNSQTRRCKYIDIRYHHLQDNVRLKTVVPEYTPTQSI
eukprot:IDg2404t1